MKQLWFGGGVASVFVQNLMQLNLFFVALRAGFSIFFSGAQGKYPQPFFHGTVGGCDFKPLFDGF